MKGSIIKRGKTYTMIYHCEDPKTGEKKAKWVGGFKTKGEAQKALNKALYEVENGTHIPADHITLKEYLTDWLKDHVKARLKPTTLDSYSNYIEKHIIPSIGNIKLQKLKVRDIDRFYNKLLESGRIDGKGGLSAKSVIQVHRILHKALNQAYKEEIIAKNPASLVTPPSVKKYRGKVYDHEGIGGLLIAVKDTEFELPIALSSLSGLRRGEVLGLRWSDVDLKNGTISINQQLVYTSQGLLYGSPKSDESNRTIRVPGLLLDLLAKQRKHQMSCQKLLGDNYKKDNLVCCYNDGSPIHPSSFSKMFATILKKNNLEHIRFHDLRHANASLMLKAKVQPKVASKMLGHSTIGTTMDLYSHVLDGMQNEAVNAIDELFPRSNKESLKKEKA